MCNKDTNAREYGTTNAKNPEEAAKNVGQEYSHRNKSYYMIILHKESLKPLYHCEYEIPDAKRVIQNGKVYDSYGVSNQ